MNSMISSPTIPDSVRQNERNAFAYWSYRLNAENGANCKTFLSKCKQKNKRGNSDISVFPEIQGFKYYAKKILGQINEVEHTFKKTEPKKRQFSISVPRVSYIADAFVEFSRNIGRRIR